MKKYFIIPLVAALLMACEKEKTVSELSLDTPTLEFKAEGGTKTVKITSNTDWKASFEESDWFTVEPSSGNGDKEVTITVSNYKEEKARSAEIRFEADDLFATLSIVQLRPEVPEDPSKVEMKVRAYEQEIQIEAPKGFNYKAELTGEGVSLVSTDNENITLHFEANMTGDERKFLLKVLTMDNLELEEISITQSCRNIEPGELLIEEVFFTGFVISESNNSDSSDGDQYFRLTNNTDQTLYADNTMIAISTTASQTSSTGAYWAYPELPDGVGVSTIYTIPGKGKDVAIEAGKSIILALAAQNFKAENGVGCDLSKADFEFYDISGNDDFPDIDNPDVTNLTSWIISSWSFTSLHDRGYESYVIAYPPFGTEAKKFMEEHVWTGKRVMDWNGWNFEEDIEGAYIIPNEWVLDAVNCAVEEDLGELAFNAKMDAGYTNVTNIDADQNRFGKSILRKRDSNGKLIDTNNSTNDFEICTSPTMSR